MKDSHPLITPIYQTVPGQASIILCTAPLLVRDKDQTFSGKGTVLLKLGQRFDLKVEGSLQDAFALISGGKTVELQFGEGSPTVRALITSLTIDSDECEARIALLPNPSQLETTVSGVTHVSSVTFHVVNFPKFLCTQSGFDTSNNGKLLGRVSIQTDDWDIEIQELSGTEKLVDHLKDAGGYGITHVGRLMRPDGQPFAIVDAAAELYDLYHFLSFARGGWAPPMLSVGFDAAGTRVHENWSVRITTPWEAHLSWFDLHHGEWLPLLYPGFRALLHSSELGKAVKSALYWYLRSNRGGDGSGVDSGIILSQAALERLTFAYLKASGVQLSKMKAVERLRKTLQLLHIPIEIPATMLALLEQKGIETWEDGPDAVTRIRNEIVHPQNRFPFSVGSVTSDTWRLAQWYVELLILRLAGYKGGYSNRLRPRWRGEFEPVPWKSVAPNG